MKNSSAKRFVLLVRMVRVENGAVSVSGLEVLIGAAGERSGSEPPQ